MASGEKQATRFEEQNVLWQGRVDQYGCLGIMRFRWDKTESTILHLDRNMASVQVIHPHLPDGHPLSVDLGECPVWWQGGMSALVVAYKTRYTIQLHC